MEEIEYIGDFTVVLNLDVIDYGIVLNFYSTNYVVLIDREFSYFAIIYLKYLYFAIL